MYIKRTIEKSIERANKFFPVVLVTGPRQVGKTTVLQNCEPQPRTYVSLDTLENRELAKNDPTLFLQRYPCLLYTSLREFKEALNVPVGATGNKTCNFCQRTVVDTI